MGRIHVFDDGWAFRHNERMYSFYEEGVHCAVKNSTFLLSAITPGSEAITRLCMNKTTGKTDLYEKIVCLN